MDPSTLAEKAQELAAEAQGVAEQAVILAQDATSLAASSTGGASEPFVFLFTVFVLAVFVGYYVVWSVTPALHSPLMAVTNAISSVIIVGALIAAGPQELNLAKVFGFIAVVLASINIFGGFIVTQRMLQMFRQKR
ncbi:MAG: NAD(P) transhydrogenase subunit alpha [Alphaproteobacteria bacterium]|nr:NAD(P) transhydrogenase subunit alpha [Alphaproteobacteria bacterium]